MLQLGRWAHQRCSAVQVTEIQTPRYKSLQAVNQPCQLGQIDTAGGAQEQRCPVRLDLTTASSISSTCFSPFCQYDLIFVPSDERPASFPPQYTLKLCYSIKCFQLDATFDSLTARVSLQTLPLAWCTHQRTTTQLSDILHILDILLQESNYP